MKELKKELEGLEIKLEALKIDTGDLFEITELGIRGCKETLQYMRKRVLSKGFKTKDDECEFFKIVKPKIVGYLIYFMNLIQIERCRPYGNAKMEQKFLLSQIATLQTYFWENHEFYEYYLRGLTDRDKEFFLRKNNSLKLHYDSIPSMVDHHFSTTHDMLLAKIIGNLKTIEYLQKRLLLFQENTLHPIQSEKQSSIKWTGSKVDLVELVYALHSSGSLNNGRVDLKEIAQALENLLQIQLGDYYRTFLEIRGRKIQTTKFLDHLKSRLESRMREADG